MILSIVSKSSRPRYNNLALFDKFVCFANPIGLNQYLLMRTKLIVLIVFVFFPFGLYSQEPKVILINHLQKEFLKTRGAVNRLLKKNDVSEDSLLNYLNIKSHEWMKHLFPGTNVLIVDTGLMHQVDTSSSVEEMFTSSHMEKIVAAKGFRKLQRYNQNESAVKFSGRQLNEESKTAVQMEMVKQGANYLIFLNKVDLSDLGKTGFSIHFEIYDRNLIRIYVKYVHFLRVSGNMYYSTFLFYLDYCLEGFNKNLAKLVSSPKKP